MAPPYDPDSDEREKPSWRDIDRRRDRSRHVSRDETSQKEKSLQSGRAKQQYLNENSRETVQWHFNLNDNQYGVPVKVGITS